MTSEFMTQTIFEGLAIILLIWGLICEDRLALIERRVFIWFKRRARRALRKILLKGRRLRTENLCRADIRN